MTDRRADAGAAGLASVSGGGGRHAADRGGRARRGRILGAATDRGTCIRRSERTKEEKSNRRTHYPSPHIDSNTKSHRIATNAAARRRL